MPLPIKTQDQIIRDEITAIQAALPSNFQFPVGSIVLAIVDAHSGTALWEESLVEYVLSRTRLATSRGEDVDTYLADFGLIRPAGEYANTELTCSSNAATIRRVIPIDSIFSTENNVTFQVIVDEDDPNYSAIDDGYVMNVGTLSINVPIQCTVAGTVGNVVAHSITLPQSPIPGVDNFDNPSAATDGEDTASDQAAKAYFVEYINSLSRANKSAIETAIRSVVGSIEFELYENKDYTTGDTLNGFFFAVISGSPSGALLTAAYNAVDAVRGFTIRFQIYAAIPVSVDVSATVNVPGGGIYAAKLQADIVAAVQTYISLIPIGQTLFYTRIAQIIYNVVQAEVPADLMPLVDVTNILVNGATSDITATYKQALTPGTIGISITTV